MYIPTCDVCRTKTYDNKQTGKKDSVLFATTTDRTACILDAGERGDLAQRAVENFVSRAPGLPVVLSARRQHYLRINYVGRL